MEFFSKILLLYNICFPSPITVEVGMKAVTPVTFEMVAPAVVPLIGSIIQSSILKGLF
jgi:uncharacterized protein (DUF697 family)